MEVRFSSPDKLLRELLPGGPFQPPPPMSSDPPIEDNISIYPNPAKDILTISCKYTVTIEMVVIYNQMGQKVLEIELVNNTIDLSNLQLGMYIIEVVSGQQKIREKLMIY